MSNIVESYIQLFLTYMGKALLIIWERVILLTQGNVKN